MQTLVLSLLSGLIAKPSSVSALEWVEAWGLQSFFQSKSSHTGWC
jgi:hypothetical protein